MSDIEKQLWLEENWPIGKQYGFPDCCIKEFCDMPPAVMRRSTPTQDDHLKYSAACIDGEFTGFIPCLIHAKQILSGQITLASLITDRDPLLPAFEKNYQQGLYGPEIDIDPDSIRIE